MAHLLYSHHQNRRAHKLCTGDNDNDHDNDNDNDNDNDTDNGNGNDNDSDNDNDYDNDNDTPSPYSPPELEDIQILHRQAMVTMTTLQSALIKK